MLCREIEILQKQVHRLKISRDAIITRWVDDVEVVELLSSHNIDKNCFREEYAYGVLDYFIEIIQEQDSIGHCPIIMKLLNFFESKNITVSALYTICIHFRESIVKEFFTLGLANETVYDAICHVFDANFKAVLHTYTDTIFKAKQELNEFQKIIENSLNEIYIIDKESKKFVYINKSGRKNLGYSLDDIVEMSPLRINSKLVQDQFEKRMGALIRGDIAHLIFQTIHKRSDKTLYDIELHVELMNVFGRESFIAIGNDITKQMQTIKEKNHYHKLAIHDHLTKIFNRHQFEVCFLREAKRSQRYDTPLSVIIFDIDNFKIVNDTYGHDVGDEVLVALCNSVQADLRSSDIFARWGGEEFIILLPQTKVSTATQKAEQLRNVVASTVFEKVGRVTCSFGVAQVIDFDTIKDTIKVADGALYAAKKNGRNRVEVSKQEFE